MRLTLLLLVATTAACASAPRPSMPGSPRRPTVVLEPVSGTRPPASFVRTTAEAPAMRTIAVRDGLTHQAAMRLLVDGLSQRFSVDVVDPRVGFAMTTWQASLMRDGVPDLRYRTRFTARFVDEWRTLHLQSEARWSRGEEADLGYDAVQLDSLSADLRLKLGKKL